MDTYNICLWCKREVTDANRPEHVHTIELIKERVMVQHGVAPFLECSSKGDKRLSAFYARLQCMDNKTIEEIYQAAKIFEDGSTGLNWREAKGRTCTNMEHCHALYAKLWDAYIIEHPELIPVLKEASGLSDIFGQPGHACQATELWRIRNNS